MMLFKCSEIVKADSGVMVADAVVSIPCWYTDSQVRPVVVLVRPAVGGGGGWAGSLLAWGREACSTTPFLPHESARSSSAPLGRWGKSKVAPTPAGRIL